MHIKCINSFYPRTSNQIKRAWIPEVKISWENSFLEYSPFSYTAPSILSSPPYADPDITDENFAPKWNAIDGKVNRKSHNATYEIISGLPRNYMGRTGIIGRGCLGRWGPNHAADPIVTRWKLTESGSFACSEVSGNQILQFVSIQRRDCGEWAIPGGMVDPGEKVTSTLKREFLEEALNSHEMGELDKEKAKEDLKQLFSKGTEIYCGYVDDPRNTDNAWMETVAYNFHEDETDGTLHQLKLTAGDDAQAVKWVDLSKDLKLYASHANMLKEVAKKLKSHW